MQEYLKKLKVFHVYRLHVPLMPGAIPGFTMFDTRQRIGEADFISSQKIVHSHHFTLQLRKIC